VSQGNEGMRKGMKAFIVRFPPKVLEELQREAEKRGVSASELVRTAVRHYLGGGRKRAEDTASLDTVLVEGVKRELLGDEDFLTAVRKG
jgi:metal-responsive CopG/Arc/MetJ family transcriptional regulator